MLIRRTQSADVIQRARSRWSLVTLAGVLGICAGAVALGDEPDAAAKAYAHRLAVGVCGTCHGPEGNSVQPKFPRLAGQNSNYLVTQLHNFHDQKRGDPDAIGYMWGMASQLSDETIVALADYYAVRATGPGTVRNTAQVARGREIYEHGIPTAGVPACAACHGPEARGTGDFPRLAGQHAQYIMKQLSSFQSNMRNVAVMHGVAQGLRVAEMQAVAAYVESQR